MNESALQLWHGVLFRQRPDLTFEWISPRVQEWTGLEPHQSLEAIVTADREKAGKDEATFRLRHARTGRITWVQQRRRKVGKGYEGFWEDVTDKLKLEHQLAAAHWDATLGTATHRLVHDFNNLLTGILSLSDAYLSKVEADNPLQEGLKLINQNARQAAELVQHIGALFREVPGLRSYQNLSDVAAAAAEMLRRVLPRHSTVKLEASQESVPVYVDAAELKQVIVSLGLNLEPPIVINASVEKDGARLLISGGAAQMSSATVLHAQTFADRHEASFAPIENRYTFYFRLADFSEADKETARPRSILMAANEDSAAFEMADLLRRNGYEVVVGNPGLLGLPDYRFDAVWVRGLRVTDPRSVAPKLKWILDLTTGSPDDSSLLPNADVVFDVGTSQEDMLAKLGDVFKS